MKDHNDPAPVPVDHRDTPGGQADDPVMEVARTDMPAPAAVQPPAATGGNRTVSPTEADQRLRQAARILATGAIRAAQAEKVATRDGPGG